jgi:hypothetical protein
MVRLLEMFLDLKAARVLGFDISTTLLARADEVMK